MIEIRLDSQKVRVGACFASALKAAKYVSERMNPSAVGDRLTVWEGATKIADVTITEGVSFEEYRKLLVHSILTFK